MSSAERKTHPVMPSAGTDLPATAGCSDVSLRERHAMVVDTNFS